MSKKIPENIWRFLNDDLPNAYDDSEIFILHDDQIKKLWDESKDEILSVWIRTYPGTRPLLWWKFDSSGPRQRRGGKGELISEKYPAVLQNYEKGLPTGWDSIDEEDPPQFESQGTYLQRHGLLTDAEKKFIEKNLSLFEPEAIREND
jgi:hypothetical protein